MREMMRVGLGGACAPANGPIAMLAKTAMITKRKQYFFEIFESLQGFAMIDGIIIGL
jgi:hypothetical protein